MASFAATLERSGERSGPTLDALFGANDDAFLDGDRLLCYAMALALFEWADERAALGSCSHAWRETGSGDPDRSLGFPSVLHETPAQATRE
jgi:hypothetical protein